MRQDGAADEITLLSHPLRKKLKLEGGGENSKWAQLRVTRSEREKHTKRNGEREGRKEVRR